MPLASADVDRIFNRLMATYGHRFMTQYGALKIQAVKSVWCHELSGFARDGGWNDILWAMNNLPEDPVNAIEFRNIARRAPQAPLRQLPSPHVPPERIAEAAAKINQVRAALTSRRCSGERERIAARQQELLAAGHRPTHAQLAMVRGILGDRDGDAA